MNRIERYILLFIFLNIQSLLFAQKEANVWYFHKNFGLDFNETNVKKLDTCGITTENSNCYSSICDTNGKVILYLDVMNIYNSNHEIVANYVTNIKDYVFVTNLIVRHHLSDTFTILFNAYYKETSSAFYSTFIFNLDTFKFLKQHVQYCKNAANYFTAIKMPTNNGFWIAINNNNIDTLSIYKLNSNGISLNQKIKYCEPSLKNYDYNYILTSSRDAKFSPCGRYLTFNQYGLNINNVYFDTVKFEYFFEFDINLGKIIKKRELAIMNCDFEFSSNSKYLFLTRLISNNQYKILQIHTDSLLKNKIHYDSLVVNYNIRRLQLGPDHKIYFESNTNILGRIDFPNSKIDTNNITKNIYNLPNIKPYKYSLSEDLPRICPSYLNKPYYIQKIKCLSDSSEFVLYNGYKDSVFWDFGDGNSQKLPIGLVKHLYSDTGQYTVKVKYKTDSHYDSLSKIVHIRGIYSNYTTKQYLLCSSDTLKLNFKNTSVDSIFWPNGSKNMQVAIAKKGIYTYRLKNTQCEIQDTISLDTIDCSISVQDTCYNDYTTIGINYAQADSVRLIIANQKSVLVNQNPITHPFATSGIHKCEIHYYKNKLVKTKIRNINILQKPYIRLGNDTILFDNEILQIKIPQPYTNIEWNDQSYDSIKLINKSGLYKVFVANQSCYDLDSILIQTIPSIKKDYSICQDDTLKLNLAIAADKAWLNHKLTNTINNTISLNIIGQVAHVDTLDIEIKGIKKRILINIKVIEYPKFDLGNDTNVCVKYILKPKPEYINAQYTWHNNTTQKQMMIQESGVYALKIRQNNCEYKDSIALETTNCVCDIYYPNAINPLSNNNVFSFSSSCNFKLIELEIYDRWGQMLYKSNLNTWNATLNNTILPMGVYVFKATIKNNNNDIINKSGTISVLY